MQQAISEGSHIYRIINKIQAVKTGLLLFMLLCSVHAQGQIKVSSYPLVSVSVKDVPFHVFLTLIEQQTSFKFAYNTELISKQKNVTIDVHNKPLDELFNLVLKSANISYSIIDNQIILQEFTPLPQVTISGYIKDSLSGESLPGAVIYLPEKKAGTYTNNYGFYSITQNQTDSLDIVISYVGFNRVYQKVEAQHSASLDFYLTESKTQLETILISNHEQDDNVKRNPIGKTDISLNMIKTAPAINGNGDIMNTIQMMPGVLAGLDGRPGYFIRGGNTDQNLVQLDEATLYNPNHLLGLVSIFNSSAIKSAYLLKAGFPASFGDHLSSVLDVTMKDGNDQQFGGDVQVGTIASGLTLSGPIVKDKASFFVSARRSTIDLLLKPMNFSNYYSNYVFYDVNAKLNIRISKKDRIYLSFYQGRDNSAYSKDSTQNNAINYEVNYGNQALALRWNHLFSQKIFSNTSVIYNNYYHDVTARQGHYYADLYSGIRDIDFKTDFYFYPNLNHKIATGINYLYQTLFPATIASRSATPDSETSISPSEIPKKYSGRIAVYFSDEIRLSPKFTAYIGARMPLFYNKNSQYLLFEPRLSLLHLINPTTSIKISYTQMHQSISLVQSYNASFPAEIWIGSSKIVKPQNCQEASIGLFKNSKDNMFQSSLEIYYKHMGNQLLFEGGINPTLNSNIENMLIFGQGQSYGAELYLSKTKGRLTGWLAYTLSYSYQKFDSLNRGLQFPFANDRRHSFYISASYAISKHWGISSNFLLTSGSAFTLFKDVSVKPYDLLFYNNVKGSDYDNGNTGNKVQNNFRLAPYNRLDLSIRYRKTRNLPNRVLETEWVFSVYNVYARANTFFAYCSIDPVTKQPIPVEVSFVPIIPSISYNLKF